MRAIWICVIGLGCSSDAKQVAATPVAVGPAADPVEPEQQEAPALPADAPVVPADPPAPDVSGLVPPEPDATIAALPIDARVPSWTAVLEHHRRDCDAFKAPPCELVGDFDGDGKKDRAVKIRERTTRRAGIAIRWASGEVSIIGAGVASRQLSTDVSLDGIELSWSVVEEDLEFLQRWSIARRAGTGFVEAGPPRPVGGPRRESPAPAATGAGILLDGGDAAEVLYWDGTRWRRLILGY
jgi:hypothetical protein